MYAILIYLTNQIIEAKWCIYIYIYIYQELGHQCFIWPATYSAPSHHLNQCWHMANWTHEIKLHEISITIQKFSFKMHGIKFWWKLNQNIIIFILFIHTNAFANFFKMASILSHPQHVNSLRPSDAYICVKLTIIGSDNDLSPGRRQAIIWTYAGILLIRPLGKNFNETSLIEIHTFSFNKIHFKMASGKWPPFCLGLNVLRKWTNYGWINKCGSRNSGDRK